MPEPRAEMSFGAPGGMVVRTLVLTDLVDSTRLFETLGDARASEVSALHDRRVRDLVAEFGAREIDKTDGFLLLFERPIDGVHFALEYHQALRALSEQEGLELRARAGIHLGEVFLRENALEDVARGAKPLEVEGLAKPMAARVMSLALGGQTLLTQSAFDLARRGSVGSPSADGRISWLSHGRYVLKGVNEPLEVFEVGVEGVAPLEAPPDSAKARRAVRAGDEITLGWRAAKGQQVPNRPNWSLTEKLGEGGFGEIWLATHPKTGDQRVFKFCYDADRLRALRREVTLFRLLRETLGHRSDIGRILDWNFDEAPYSLEMEYSEAGNLAAWADEQGGLDRVPLATRLELVAQVAEALAAAHSVGILHKDVKPANVLISTDRDGRPQSVLTDFGIGMLTDMSLLAAKGITAAGMTAMTAALQSATGGTQLYMAPELLEGKAPTIQADIYSLGVLLYQVAVGDFHRALAPGWDRDVEDELLGEDIAAFVDGVPERRPASAQEVADRIRHLDERRAEREAERRVRKDAERSRRLRKLWAVTAAVATVFLVVVSFLAFQAFEAREEAHARREQAEGLIDFMLFDLRDGLQAIGRLDLLGKVAGEALDYFGSLPEGSESAAATRRRGLALLIIGEVLAAQGDLRTALTSSRKAQTLFEELVAQDPAQTDWQGDLARSHIRIGSILRDQNETVASLASYRAAQTLFDRLASQDPENPEWPSLAARCHILIGHTLGMQGEMADSLESYRTARELYQRLVAESPADPAVLDELADCHYSIGKVLADQGDSEAALDSFRAAHEIYEHFAIQDETNVSWQSKLAFILRSISKVHFARGDLELALEQSSVVRSIFERIARNDPTNTTWQIALASSLSSIGEIYFRQGNWADALESHTAANKIYEFLGIKLPDEKDVQYYRSESHVEIGRVFAEMGDTEKATREWTRAIEIVAPLAEHSEDVYFLDTHARALLHLGRVEEARPIVETLLASEWDSPPFMDLVRRSGVLKP